MAGYGTPCGVGNCFKQLLAARSHTAADGCAKQASLQEHAGPPPKDMPKRPATQWVKPGIKAREEDLRHASLQDFWDES
ncbi:MAG: hypothetical protein EOR07_26305 [Mesorhizobium sp.]|nr:MAG: hypothetical protein EOR07_26305 [Mesorhizobium sp.]